jgi:hypothetical protein
VSEHLVSDRDRLLMSGQVPMDWFSGNGKRYKVRFIPLLTLHSGPRSGFAQILSDYWWAVHPMLGGIMAGRTPQANRDRRFTEDTVRRLYPGASVQFIHKAIVPIDLNDYLPGR